MLIRQTARRTDPKDVVWWEARQTKRRVNKRLRLIIKRIIRCRLALFGVHAKLARRAVWRVERSMHTKKMTVTTRSFTSYIHCARLTTALLLFSHMQSWGDLIRFLDTCLAHRLLWHSGPYVPLATRPYTPGSTHSVTGRKIRYHYVSEPDNWHDRTCNGIRRPSPARPQPCQLLLSQIFASHSYVGSWCGKVQLTCYNLFMFFKFFKIINGSH